MSRHSLGKVPRRCGDELLEWLRRVGSVQTTASALSPRESDCGCAEDGVRGIAWLMRTWLRNGARARIGMGEMRECMFCVDHSLWRLIWELRRSGGWTLYREVG